jgi:fibronectin-binding autotransporter adhesin
MRLLRFPLLTVWAWLLIPSSPAWAQLQWGANGAGGGGSWDSTTLDWFDGSNNVAWVSGDSAAFSGTTGTVTLSGAQIASQLTFANGSEGYLLTGGTLEGTTAGLTIETDADATINSAINSFFNASNPVLTKTGNDTLTLDSSVSNFTQINLNAGTLALNNGGTAADVNLSNSTAVTLLENEVALYGISGGGAGGVIKPTNSATPSGLALEGANSEIFAGSLQDNGAGILSLDFASPNVYETFTGANTYSGETSISGGGLTLAGNGTIANSTSISVEGFLEVDNSTTNNSNRLNDSANVEIANGKILFLGNASAASTETTGNLEIFSGVNNVEVDAGTGQSAVLTFTGLTRDAFHGVINFSGTGTTQITGISNANGIIGGYATLNGTDWASLDPAGNIVTPLYNSNINAASDTDNVKLAGGGLTNLQASQVINSLNQQNSSASSAVLDLNGQTLGLTSGGTLSSGTGSTVIQDGTLTTSGAELFVVDSNNQTISAAITGTAALVKYGTGTLVLSGNNAYSGETYVQAGTLQISNSGSTTLNGFIQSAGTVIYDLNANAVIKGEVTGGTILQDGTGTLTIGARSFSVTSWTVNSGALDVDFSQTAAPSATNIISPGTALILGGGTLEVNGHGSLTNSQTVQSLTLNPGGSTITLNQNGNTKLTLALGTITRNAGAFLNFSNAPAATGIVATASNANLNGILGTWATTGSGTSLAYATMSGGDITAYAGATSAGSNLSAMSSATTNYVTTNPTSFVFSNATGNTLQYKGPATAGTIMLNGATLTLNGLMNAAAGSLTISGPGAVVAGSSQELAITGNTQSTTISATVADTSSSNTTALTYGGAGKLTLSATTGNSYSGGTIVASGTLLLGNTTGSATGSGALTVAHGATIGGTGASRSSSFTVNGTVMVGNGTDSSSTTTLTGTALSTITNASLEFNLGVGGNQGQSNVLELGATPITFGDTALTLNILGNSSIHSGTAYVLITDLEGFDPSTDGLTVGSNGQVISGLSIAGNSFFGASENGYTTSGPLAGSYLFISGDNLEVEVVPEPRVWTILLLGLGLIFWRFRSVRRRAPRDD